MSNLIHFIKDRIKTDSIEVDEHTLISASKVGNISMVKYIYQSDPTINLINAVVIAIERDHLRAVKFLLKKSNLFVNEELKWYDYCRFDQLMNKHFNEKLILKTIIKMNHSDIVSYVNKKYKLNLII